MDHNSFELILTVLFFDIFVVDVFVEIDFMGKRERSVHFGLLEGFQIENDSLQVNNDDVRQTAQKGFLGDFLFFVTRLTKIVINAFWLDEFFETVS